MMAASSLNIWRTTANTGAKKMLSKSENITHPCRSPCSSSNRSKQTPSSGHTQVLTLLWNCRITAITCGGTPIRVSTCHRRVRSTVSYAFWRSMKRMKRHSCLPPNFLQLAHHKHPVRGRAIRSKPTLPHRQQSLGLAVIAKSPGNHLKEHLTRV